MPSLVAGYRPATVPEPGADTGYGFIGQVRANGPEQPVTHVLIWDDRAVFPPPAAVTPPDDRAPGILREQYANPAVAYFARNPHDIDNDAELYNPRGQHVMQSAGATIARDRQAPEPPMYGSTWRIEPVAASEGWYIGNG